MNRYDRQQLIEQWDQEKLTKARIAIASDGLLGELALIMASGMGFGDIEYFRKGSSKQNARERREYPTSIFARESIADYCRELNDEISIMSMHLDVGRNTSQLGDYDLIIDTTNDPASKYSLAQSCALRNIPLVSASSTLYTGLYGVYDPRKVRPEPAESVENSQTGAAEIPHRTRGRRRPTREETPPDRQTATPAATNYRGTIDPSQERLVSNLLFLECAGSNHGIETAGAMAGLAIEEARKIIAPLGIEPTLDDVVTWNPFHDPHFVRQDRLNGLEGIRTKRLRVAQVGCGALGTFYAMYTCLRGDCDLDLMDFDTIEDHNLGRQVLFAGKVGALKAPALAERLEMIGRGAAVRPHNLKIGLEDIKRFRNYDLIVDCLDNFQVRALLNYISREYGIPLISGGTGHAAGQAITCKDACLDCQFDINRKASQRRERESHSCIHAPTPSVVTSNAIIAAFETAQSSRLESAGGFPLWTYSSREELRIGEIPSTEKCDCTGTSLRPVIEELFK